MLLSSLQNPRVKETVKLRQRSHRDEAGLMLIEGYRDLFRALEFGHPPARLFTCPEFFLGQNEPALIDRCAQAGAEILPCTRAVFEKMAYRDRPEGLLAVAPQLVCTLDRLVPPSRPLLLVAESIEKPGNLGTLLRSADAAGAHGVLVADPRTDVHNPNVVRASTGMLFAVPLAVADSPAVLAWLKTRGIAILAATPHADREYTEVDMTRGVAIVVGTEQVGLSDAWMSAADLKVRIPMLGKADSLNVAQAATLLLYEAARQRRRSSSSGASA
ncbi:MAG: 23S rRNA (uridine(2479)-2'-O)-methyltransferase [Lentisphaerae bacterium ADurb.BinA184]|nr:MAG: 23S rRNA (uridine(2479)-2'-O)-methyltransferase [Lentisphaerae bacterium ADurb.BinA184]